MKKFLGVLLIICGVLLGLYLGVYVMLTGGIVNIIKLVKTSNYDAIKIAINIIRILFSSAVGGISFYIFAIPGYKMLIEG